nr:hypothetical protein [Tanacetum cinerariifolium]
MYDDMTYSMLVQMVVKKFSLDSNDRLSSIHLIVRSKDNTRSSEYFQATLIRKDADVMGCGPEHVMPTQEYVRKIIKDAFEDDHFMRDPWLSTVDYLNAKRVIAAGYLGDMKYYCRDGKFEMVVGVIKSCTLRWVTKQLHSKIHQG